jgi:hypothetical protein
MRAGEHRQRFTSRILLRRAGCEKTVIVAMGIQTAVPVVLVLMEKARR